MRTARNATLGLIGLVLLAGCGSLDGQLRTPGEDEYNPSSRRAEQAQRAGGGQGILVFGTDRSRREGGDQTGIGVNAFLWRATLDTLGFLPLTSADPFGGVVLSDWYQPPGARGERFRATAYILGRELRSDAVRVTVFRQVQQGSGWQDSASSASMNAEFEDRILARARELRTQSLAGAR